jgi:hypothetical protein
VPPCRSAGGRPACLNGRPSLPHRPVLTGTRAAFHTTLAQLRSSPISCNHPFVEQSDTDKHCASNPPMRYRCTPYQVCWLGPWSSAGHHLVHARELGKHCTTRVRTAQAHDQMAASSCFASPAQHRGAAKRPPQGAWPAPIGLSDSAGLAATSQQGATPSPGPDAVRTPHTPLMPLPNTDACPPFVRLCS